MLTHSCFVIIVVQFRRQPLPLITTALVGYYSRGREGGGREGGREEGRALERASEEGLLLATGHFSVSPSAESDLSKTKITIGSGGRVR